MDTREIIEKAGGAKVIEAACHARGVKANADQITTWKARNAFPRTEWTGETSVVGVICELIRTVHRIEIYPIEVCPGAGQYMIQPEQEAA